MNVKLVNFLIPITDPVELTEEKQLEMYGLLMKYENLKCKFLLAKLNCIHRPKPSR
jgi:hypothetical protein